MRGIGGRARVRGTGATSGGGRRTRRGTRGRTRRSWIGGTAAGGGRAGGCT